MSRQNPLDNYGLERIRMEEDDRYVWVYYAGKVENIITKLTKENAELKDKLESVQATAYTESVDAGMSNRRLKRALWLARAERALAERRRYCAMAAFENIENDALRIKWCKIQHKCIKKAEEYK